MGRRHSQRIRSRNLPAPLRIKLRNAVVSLDARLMSEVIREIAEQDAVLGSTLARYTDKLAYSPILKAVDGVEEE